MSTPGAHALFRGKLREFLEVKKGQLEVMGALFDNKTGRVEFMGSFGEDFDSRRLGEWQNYSKDDLITCDDI